MSKALANNRVTEFIDAINSGMASLARAGEIAAEAIKENPKFIDDVCDACPDITPETVRRFEAIGLKQLHPRLAISEAPGVQKLRKMPYKLQERYSVEPIPLLINNSGKWDTIIVDVRNLTSDQAKQVFNCERIRSEAEQRAWIEDRASKKAAPMTRANLPYRHDTKKLVVMEPCTFDRKELATILAEMI